MRGEIRSQVSNRHVKKVGRDCVKLVQKILILPTRASIKHITALFDYEVVEVFENYFPKEVTTKMFFMLIGID